MIVFFNAGWFKVFLFNSLFCSDTFYMFFLLLI